MIKNKKPKLITLRSGLFPKFRLAENYYFYFRHNGKIAQSRIKAGYEYDGATGGSFIFFRRSLHKEGFTLFHDFGYEFKGDVKARYIDKLGRPNGLPFKLEKQELDTIFLESARRDVNVQNWRTLFASAAFKTVSWFWWWF